MSNKFLGLDSINVLTEYINQYVDKKQNSIQLITLQLYKYSEEELIETPGNGYGYDFDENRLIIDYNGKDWSTLKHVMEYIESINNPSGAIYMSSTTLHKGQTNIEWSKPLKISGENGKDGVKFAYSYYENPTTEQVSYKPLNVIDENDKHIVYFWVTNEDGTWPEFKNGNIWSMLAKDGNTGREIRYEFCATNAVDEDNKPVSPDNSNSSNWKKSISLTDFSRENPYLWMRYKVVYAGSSGEETPFSDEDIVLFSHYGQDGNVPDYTITLFKRGYINREISDINGIIKPNKPAFIENGLIDDYINKDGWVELPEDDNIVEEEIVVDDNSTEDITIWWQCTFKVDGRTNKVLSEESIGAVKRYNAIDGTAKPGQFTMNLYAWSKNQLQPAMSEELIDDWRPKNYTYLPDKPFDENGNILEEFKSPEASLWMITANVAGLDENGHPVVNGSWSEPIKLTGPRGPIGYDYRVETRYMEGTENSPRVLPEEESWNTLDGKMIITSREYPYIWAANYLVMYKMQYSLDNNGNYIVDQNTGEYEIKPSTEEGKLDCQVKMAKMVIEKIRYVILLKKT